MLFNISNDLQNLFTTHKRKSIWCVDQHYGVEMKSISKLAGFQLSDILLRMFEKNKHQTFIPNLICVKKGKRYL